MLIPFRKYSSKNLPRQDLYVPMQMEHWRKSTRIAIIDDQRFPRIDDLQPKYRISHLHDVLSDEDIDSLGDFPIVLCDINKVGTFLSAKRQGAFVIERLRKRFPTKYVIGYSGSHTSENSRLAETFAHRFFTKNTTSKSWQAELDQAIISVHNPAWAWTQIRNFLDEHKYPPKDVRRLENLFVRRVISGKAANSAGLAALINNSDFSEESKAVFLNLVSSIAWDSFKYLLSSNA